MADFNLLEGSDWETKLSSSHVTYALVPESTAAGSAGYKTAEWSAYQKSRVAEALALFSAATNLTFELVEDDQNAIFRLALTDETHFTDLEPFHVPGGEDDGPGILGNGFQTDTLNDIARMAFRDFTPAPDAIAGMAELYPVAFGRASEPSGPTSQSNTVNKDAA
ncbi:hypothetical protein ACFFJ7_14040 [Pseudochelatococcus lubricantis]|uniref:hypothetical protein n=1 Tax=Pseudochelatococcus lubricantis TaxID=1538102 RepID=UPI0035EA39B8